MGSDGSEEEWMEEKSEERSGQSLKIHPVEKTYSEEAQEALYDMEQFFQKESVGAMEKKLREVAVKRKRTVFLNIRRGMKNLKNSKPI